MVQSFLDGGNYMWPILVCLIAGIVFSIERIYHLIMARTDIDKFAQDITETLSGEGIKAAISKCDSAQGPVRNIYLAALERIGLGAAQAEKAIENRGALEMANLEKNMAWITFFIGTAPMLGFLGTVVGMIQAFKAIESANDISPAVVAGGISIALLTTAFGLIVAVILQFFQNLALNMIEGHIVSMEKGSMALVETITDLESKGGLKS